MTPKKLDKIGVNRRDHVSALWWLFFIYRSSALFTIYLIRLSLSDRLKAILNLFLHSLPYISVLLILSGALFGRLGAIFTSGIILGVIGHYVIDIANFVLAIKMPGQKLARLGIVLFLLTLWLLAPILTGKYILSFPASYLLILLISLTLPPIIISLRPYNILIHFILMWPRPIGRLYTFHPLYWDTNHRFSFPKVHRLLTAYAKENPVEAEWHIEWLIANAPEHRYEALVAKTILVARKSAELKDLILLDQITARLPEGLTGFLRQTELVHQWISEISNLQARLNTLVRPVLRQATVKLLCQEIENFRHRIAGFDEPLRTEFQNAAKSWLQVAQKQLKNVQTSIKVEAAIQVFRYGVPVDREQEAFAGRISVISELEQQIMLSTGCPGIVLFGHRRTGKSSVLRNIIGFLPTNVLLVSVSMQNPVMFISIESAIVALHDEIRLRLPSLPTNETNLLDLKDFFNFLTICNLELGVKGQRLLLAVDEYETIDAKIGEGVFSLDMLATIRESIQTHRRITWIFAGSHEIYELKNAAWTSYLVSARTIEVPAFTEAETHLLLTEPMKHSSLWRNNEEKRPRFAASFWGDGGIERIHAEAGGWPHLVQLVAETIVDLVNLEEVSQVTPDLFERALDKSIVRGQNVLYELMHRESTLPGEWEYLLAFKKTDTQPPPQDEAIAASLRRRLLIAEENGEWRLRVPLMARWLKQRGQ